MISVLNVVFFVGEYVVDVFLVVFFNEVEMVVEMVVREFV